MPTVVMIDIAILTNFTGYDEAYALNQCVRNIVKILTRNGYKPRLIMRGDVDVFRLKTQVYVGAEIVTINPREDLYSQLSMLLEDIDFVFTHDLLMQRDLEEYELAARQIAAQRPHIRWLHTVHSLTTMRKVYGTFPNSTLWTYSQPEMMAERYSLDKVTTLPAPMDFLEFFHPISQEIARPLMDADIILCYPCRLDRGKHPEKVIDIGIELVNRGYDARVIIVNSYSNQGDKAKFREELRGRASNKVQLILTSDYEGCEIRTPRQVVMDLFQLVDVLVQPSQMESYSRVVCEAAWNRCLLVLNNKVPAFQNYNALWLSDENLIDKIISQVAGNHRKMRQERSIEVIWPKLKEIIEDDSYI